MEIFQVLPQRVRLDLGLMVKRTYSGLYRSSEVALHHHMQLSVTFSSSPFLNRYNPSAEDRVHRILLLTDRVQGLFFVLYLRTYAFISVFHVFHLQKTTVVFLLIIDDFKPLILQYTVRNLAENKNPDIFRAIVNYSIL